MTKTTGSLCDIVLSLDYTKTFNEGTMVPLLALFLESAGSNVNDPFSFLHLAPWVSMAIAIAVAVWQVAKRRGPADTAIAENTGPLPSSTEPKYPGTRSVILIALINIAVAVVVLFFERRLWHNDIPPYVAPLISLFVVCLVIILVALFESDEHAERRSDRRDEEFAAIAKKLQSQSSVMLQRFENVVDCSYLGPGPRAMAEVLSRLGGALEVRNTFVLFNLAEEDAYDKSSYELAKTAISNFLLSGGTWTDILSQGISPNGSWLGGILRAIDDRQNAESQAKRLAAKERYRRRHQITSYPVINFMIVRYRGEKEDTEEVIFGWGHHVEDPMGRVFVSRNSRLVATFDAYWKVLRSDSTEVKTLSTAITPHDIKGVWFRVSYFVDHDRKARQGPPSGEIRDVAVLIVELSNDRNVVVHGRRFEKRQSDGWVRIRGFRSTSTDLRDSRLWFSTTSAGDDNQQIAGWYKFLRDGKPESPVESFFGEFVEYVAGEPPPDSSQNSASASQRKFNMNLGRLLVFGWRIEPQEPFPEAPRDQLRLVHREFEKWEKDYRKRFTNENSMDSEPSSEDHTAADL